MIYQRLAESVDHPNAETVFLRVKPDLPSVSLATVYRNLKLFAGADLIDEVATGRSLSRYDANQNPHHHLICRSCGSVDDYFEGTIDCLAAVLGAGASGGFIGSFAVQDARLNVYGVCGRCRSMQSRREDGAVGTAQN